MEIIGFIRIFMGRTRRWIRFSKDLTFLIPSSENGDNWIYSDFYGLNSRWIRFLKDLIFLTPPENGDNWIYSDFYVEHVVGFVF